LLDLPQGVEPDFLDDPIQDIPLVILLSHVCLVNKIWGSPIEMPNSMGCGVYKASRMDADIVIAAVASGLATSNKSVFFHKWQPMFVKVLQQNEFSVDSRLEVFVLELGRKRSRIWNLVSMIARSFWYRRVFSRSFPIIRFMIPFNVIC
jgi:hypothetical protein